MFMFPLNGHPQLLGMPRQVLWASRVGQFQPLNQSFRYKKIYIWKIMEEMEEASDSVKGEVDRERLFSLVMED